MKPNFAHLQRTVALVRAAAIDTQFVTVFADRTLRSLLRADTSQMLHRVQMNGKCPKSRHSYSDAQTLAVVGHLNPFLQLCPAFPTVAATNDY